MVTMTMRNAYTTERLRLPPNADLTASRARFQIRLRVNQVTGEGAGLRYAGPSSDVPPQLTITYRKR
jgi:hypothetical protein